MSKERLEWSDSAICAFDIVAGEFVVVTAEAADIQAYAPLKSVLRRLRGNFGVEAVFVSQWANGGQLVHRVHDSSGEDDPLHAVYGAQLLEPLDGSRLPDGEQARFDAIPVISDDGIKYGTLCCRRIVPAGQDAEDLRALRSVARLIAKWFDEAALSLSSLMPLQGHSVMGSLPMHLS